MARMVSSSRSRRSCSTNVSEPTTCRCPGRSRSCRCNHARRVEHRDARRRPDAERPRRDALVVDAVHPPHLAGLPQLRNAVVELVVVRQPVHQAQPHRVSGRNGPGRAAAASRPRSSCAPTRMPRTSCSYMSLLSDSVISRCAGVNGFLRELVDGGLVRADLQEVRVGAQLVERPRRNTSYDATPVRSSALVGSR